MSSVSAVKGSEGHTAPHHSKRTAKTKESKKDGAEPAAKVELSTRGQEAAEATQATPEAEE